jgi:hypothetical protein
MFTTARVWLCAVQCPMEKAVSQKASANFQTPHQKMASILILPDCMLGAVGAHLPLYSARVTSRVCRRLHAAFPAVLPRRSDGAHTHPVWFGQPTDGRQLSSIAQWSRAYALSASCMSWFTDACAAELANVHTLNLSRTEVTDAGAAALGNVHTLSLRAPRSPTSARPRSATSTRST